MIHPGIPLVPRFFQHPNGYCLTDGDFFTVRVTHFAVSLLIFLFCAQIARGRVTYVPIPKVASTSIRHILLPPKGAHPTDLVSKSQINSTLLPMTDLGDRILFRNMHPILKESSFKFAVVRDPLERFASAWREVGNYRIGQEKLDRCRSAARLTFRTLVEPGFIDSVTPSAWSMRQAASGEVEFWRNTSRWQLNPGRAIRRMACLPEMDAHLTPQSQYLKPFLGELNMVLSINDLEAVAQVLRVRLGTSHAQAMGHHNRKPGWPSTDEFAALLSAEERDIWCWLHIEDYLRFHRFFQSPPWCGSANQAAERRSDQRSVH
jgi:hypothetical protein